MLQGSTSKPIKLRGWLSVVQSLTGTVTIPSEMSGTNTEDANATPQDIRKGAFAYVKGERIEGEIPVIDYVPEDEVKLWPAGAFTVEKDSIYDHTITVSVNMSEIDKTLIPKNIRAGVTIKKNPYNNVDAVAGTFTADADAEPENIDQGKIAYVKGKKVIGTRKDTVKESSGTASFGTTIPTLGRKVELYPLGGDPYYQVQKNDITYYVDTTKLTKPLMVNEGGDIKKIKIVNEAGMGITQTISDWDMKVRYTYFEEV